MTGGTGGADDVRTASLLLRVWSEPGSPDVLRARLLDADGVDAGSTFSTAVGDADIGRQVLHWLSRVRTGPAPAEPAPGPPPGRSPLVTTAWLADHLDDPDLLVLQVGDRRDPAGSGRIPGAGRLDWLADLGEPGRRGVADPATFAATMDRLGVRRGAHVVLAGDRGPELAATAYWRFRHHGHPRLSLLDGGVPRWAAEGRDLAADTGGPAPTTGYRAGPGRRDLLVTRDQLLAGFVGAPPGTALVDCRSRAEFAGEPTRPYDVPVDRHRLTGHVPGARNLPGEDLLGPDGRLISTVHIEQLCAALGLAPTDQVVVYCGVNDRSALVWFALKELLGWPDVRCYIGGWAEYGSLTGTDTEHGA